MRFLSMRVYCLAGPANALYISQSSFNSVSADIGDDLHSFSRIMTMGGQIGDAVTELLTPCVGFRWTTSFSMAADFRGSALFAG